MQEKFFGFIVFLCIAGLCTGCNKSIDSSGKIAYLSVTHAAPNVSSLDILFENNSLISSGQLAFDSTTGFPGNPYLSAVSGIHNFKVGPDNSSSYIDGNIGLQAGRYYSVFIYDTLSAGKLKSLILQDGLVAPVDTLSSIRFLNFSPDTASLSFIIINADTTYALDTLSPSAVPYIGVNPNPTNFSSFPNEIRSGFCRVQIIRDSSVVLYDSLTLTGGKIYTIYSKGFYGGSGATALGLKMIQHN